MKQLCTVSLAWATFHLEGEPGSFEAKLVHLPGENGIDFVVLKWKSEVPQVPTPLKLSWFIPAIDIQSRWHSGANWRRGNEVDWFGGLTSRATSEAPVIALHNRQNQNKLTFALSDGLNPIRIKAGVREEDAVYLCELHLFEQPLEPLTEYSLTLRLDSREIPYYQSLNEVSQWWASLPGYTPAPVPNTARMPMYSTWYSFHQNLTPEGIENQCRLAKELGCEAVIVDDGWQTANSERGYAYCGDWQVAPERIPDMKAHVAAVHQVGLRYLLWYSVPFVGIHSQAWSRFKNKFLESIDMTGTVGVLDPRFPEVREYLIGLYEQALQERDLDGFKLDFVDSFAFGKAQAIPNGELGGRDYASVPAAVDRLLTDVMQRLRAIRPDVMIEFRQSYVGPLMRKYGNMFRAGDCPYDVLSNRLRTLDIRLICGDTACHADMMMWHTDEPVEIAALQLVHTLFAVPQISVLIDELPQDQQEMMRFWLGWWREHRELLLDGSLRPLQPEALYPVVASKLGSEAVVAAYDDVVVKPPFSRAEWREIKQFWLINGTTEERIVVELTCDAGHFHVEARDCQGRLVHEAALDLRSGLNLIKVPRSGLVRLVAA